MVSNKIYLLWVCFFITNCLMSPCFYLLGCVLNIKHKENTLLSSSYWWFQSFICYLHAGCYWTLEWVEMYSNPTTHKVFAKILLKQNLTQQGAHIYCLRNLSDLILARISGMTKWEMIKLVHLRFDHWPQTVKYKGHWVRRSTWWWDIDCLFQNILCWLSSKGAYNNLIILHRKEP